ncbi:hypothetical protein C5610_05745 [Idiomarina sp. OT37-5b]|nr:hypothetical protein C5610_05745 [Idiomarina sp. OT37-5b]
MVAPGEQAFRQKLIEVLTQVDGARKTNSRRRSKVHTAAFTHELTSEKYQDDEVFVNAIDNALDEIEPIVKETSGCLARQLPAIEES